MLADKQKPIFEFISSVLHIDTPHAQMRIRWHPKPLAEELVPGARRWRVFWPEFRLLWPQGGEESIGGYTLDLETGPASADVQSRKHAAFPAFRSELPADIVRVVEPFASHQWALMVLLNERPQTMGLAISNPVLAYALAGSSQLRRTRDDLAALHARWNCQKKQRALVKWLGFPDTEAMVRLFRKISPESASPAILRLFRNAIAADKRVLELMNHLPTVNAAVLELVTHPKVINVVTPKLLLEVAGRVRTHNEPSLADTILASLDLVREMTPRRVVRPFASLNQVHRFQEVTDAAYQTHLRLKEMAAEAARIAAERVHRRRQEQEQARARQRRERYAELALRPLPPPPIPGTTDIIAITSREQLRAEAKEQHNCVGSYWLQVLSGRTYIYRVTSPERATLSLFKGRDGLWRRSELSGPGNRKVKPETVKAVDRWILRHWMRN